ncbi:MAG TPA: hypothetical protein PKA20_22215 [Burkholderiaceae bacterium]|nr:hypothetical protein [Burkholderiaceae bacterium]
MTFDDAAALAAALASPIRREMRADYDALPRFAGAVHHHVMLSTIIR